MRALVSKREAWKNYSTVIESSRRLDGGIWPPRKAHLLPRWQGSVRSGLIKIYISNFKTLAWHSDTIVAFRVEAANCVLDRQIAELGCEALAAVVLLSWNNNPILIELLNALV